MEVKEVNELLKRQEGYFNELQVIFRNIKKDSPSRKTSAYIAQKTAQVKDVFSKASLNHDRLQQEEVIKEHSYSKTRYFQNICDEYTDIMKYLDTCKEQAEVVPKKVEPESASRSATGKDDSPILVTQLARIRDIQVTLRQATEAMSEGKNQSYLQHLLSTLQRKWQDTEGLHFTLIADRAVQQHEYIQEGVFESVQREVDKVIQELCSKTSGPSQSNQYHGVRRVKLPTIEMPIFNGRYESWTSFSDLFRKIIHEDGTLTATEKMQYLKTHVKGDAAKLISHLTVGEAHYYIAWSLLENRFNNERLVLTKYINAILYAKKVDRPNAENLRSLYDSVNESLEAIKTHKIDVSTWDPILTSIIASKWDTETNEKYEHQLADPHKPQTFSSMMKFLERRFMCLEAAGSRKYATTYTPLLPGTSAPVASAQSRDPGCWYCRKPNHSILACHEFQALEPIDRNKVVRDNHKCTKCLTHNSEIACASRKAFPTWRRQGQHSLLHVSDSKPVHSGQYMQRRETLQKPSTDKQASQTRSNVATTSDADVALLATALVQIQSADGTPHVFRALCDQGSEASFCTEQVAQLLAYPRNQIQAQISGLADEKPKTSKFSINVEIQPAFQSQYKLRVNMIVMSRLTGAVPLEDVPVIDTANIKSRSLADPNYYKKAPIDIILGVREFGEILTTKCRKLNSGTIAQETRFGWVLSGICRNHTKAIKIVSLTTRTTELQQLHKFWELEEVENKIHNNSEDEVCEKYYQETTVRNEDGSYTVRIPFQDQNKEYGDSRRRAAARLIQLEKRFAKNESLQQRYQEFLSEYLKMGHMKKVPRAGNGQGKFYFPHQPVINENSLTTKLRVVFDGSSKASKADVSLNENMLTGPRLQEDLTTILLRWRKHRIVFMADIEKMYRFIRINQQDLGYQRILWRESPKNSMDEYELTTVTYGTASAPYLAVKTLQQLAIDEKHRFPEASKVALQDFYVDDVLSGHDDVQTAKKLQKELIQLLQAGGFNLRKWSSNSAELLESMPEENKENKLLTIPLDETRKSLGVLWSPLEDKFSFQVTINKNDKPTKRFILSEIAKLFDPLGWLAPIITNMKLIIQELWTNGTEWDQTVEGTIKTKWLEIQDQLKAIEGISIPRWCQYTTTAIVDLHGFCDASEKAYGAVIYCRVQVNEQTYKVAMLQAKSKVAPKKQKATLPRLELCAAVLLTQLMEKVLGAIKFENPKIYCWTDSMIALGWIKGEPERWKTFVANRVTEIQRTTPQAKWNHVVSSQNPADVISRGIAPSKLQEFKLWWEGPEWLKSKNIPTTKTIPEICDEIKRSFHVSISSKPRNEVLERFSSFHKMVRVLSYCMRWKYKLNKGKISCEEIARTTKQILKVVQKESFKEEYKVIKTELPVNKKSKLSSLDPFIDTDGLLRVGGRLQNANLPYDQKHPVILPYNHHITKIVVQDAHMRMLHGTNNQTMAYLRQKFWIIGAKVMVKNCYRRCVKCMRYNASTMTQKMGMLPAARVTESFPFSHTGVDYAGPIQIRAAKGRGHKSYRGYVAVFVCFASKAIHLEPAGDLSAESFIAAFRRFVARRGPVAHIYSDNATNFVGTANMLYQEILEISQSSQVQNTMTDMGITWHFIPPASPHFGGIWEAGVKSMKHHLRRVIGDQTLTFEEMTTFLSQTEACLNSRPLCALSDEASDNIVLTPSHLLIGREAVGTADPVSNIFTSLSTRWKQIQKMKKDFWKSWTKDYLHQLQQKYKWKNNQENLKIGAVVLMKEDNIGPSRWPIAKVIEVHEGKDNLTRVVTLRKSSGSIMKRSIHTLIPLPLDETENNEQTSQSIRANREIIRASAEDIK